MKPSPLESNILSNDIVISSTSELGQASQSAIVRAISFVRSLVLVSEVHGAVSDQAHLEKLIIFLIDSRI
jgi:hypothetical protein